MKETKKAYYAAFGKHLEELIKLHDTDAPTVAALGKIEPKQVYRVINAEHAASLGTIISIAKGLGVKPKALFDFDFDLGE